VAISPFADDFGGGTIPAAAGLPWDKVVSQTFAPERQQVTLGPRWMMGAGSVRPADWSVTAPALGTGFDIPSLVPTVLS